MNHSTLTALEAWLDIAVAEVQVRVAPYAAVRRASNGSERSAGDQIPVDDLETFMQVKAGHFIRAACLSRSLALVRFLRRRGVAAELRMGLGGGDTETGHAWVEVAGQAVGEPPTVEQVYGRMDVSEPVPPVSSDGRLTIPPDIAWQTIAGEAVLVNLTTGMSLGLNETGTFIWKRLAGSTIDEIVAAMVEQFDASIDDARSDVEVLVSELRQRGFVV